MNWEKRQKFSIRKFAVGAASVVIGQFFVGHSLGDQVVSADEAAALVDENSSEARVENPAQPSSVSVSEAPKTVAETAPAATSAGESTGNKEVSAAHAETAISTSAEAVVGPAEKATTPAASNTGAQEAAKDLIQAETVRYKVSYVDENGQVIYTTVKEAIIQAGQESVTVTEDGRELANEAALANYGDESGNSLVRTATITRGGTTEIVYQVKAFANPEAATNTGSREAKIDYTIVYKDKQTDVEVYRETKSYTQSTYDTKLTTDHLIQPDIQGIAELKDYKLLEASKVAHLTEGQPNLLVFALESLVKKEREKRADNPNTQPYITLERTYGSDSRANVDFTQKKNGTELDVSYRVGLTRITFNEVELTEDAKKLGLTLADNGNGYVISGRVPLDNRTKAGVYDIGVQSKTQPTLVRKTANLTISDANSFVLMDVRASIGGYANEGDDKVSSGQLDTPIDDSVSFSADTKTIYAPVTTFGYHLEKEYRSTRKKVLTIEDATSTTNQYTNNLWLTISENPNTFNAPITLTTFQQTKGQEQGVVLELIKDKEPTNSAIFQETGARGRWNIDNNPYPAYRLQFSKLPKTAGSYEIAFTTTDSLGVVKEHNYRLVTVERSQTYDVGEWRADYWIINADARYKIGDKYLIDDAETVVPQTTDAQTIGTVELNKDNATLKVVEVPSGFAVDQRTGVITKVAGTLLATGDYVIKVKAIDGHFGDNAPTRNLTIHVVTDATAIPDQVWTEGQAIPAIPITMKSGATVTNVEVEKNDQTYAYLKGGAGNQITGTALKTTTDKQEVRVVVTYTAADGTSHKVKTSFNYTVRADTSQIALDVTNAKQSVVEGNRFADMKITATAGATITVDEAALPHGTSYNAQTQTISGIGYYEGKYNVLVTATKGQKKTSKLVELTVTPGNFTVPNTSHEFVAGSEIKPIQVHMEDNWTITSVGGSLPRGLSWSSDRRQITGTPTEVGNWRAEVRIRRVTTGGTQQEATRYINIRVNSVPVSLTINNNRQTVTVLDPIQEMAVVASRGATVSMLSGSLPAGVSYDPSSGKISGTPTETGTFTATFRAAYPAIQGSQTATGTVTIVVNPRPLDVTIAGNEQTVTVLSPIQNITLSAPAKSEVTVDESKLPDGVTYNRATKTFSGTPRKVGTYEIPVTATYPTMANSPVGRATVKSRLIHFQQLLQSQIRIKPSIWVNQLEMQS